MKKVCTLIASVCLLTVFLVSCVSIQDREMSGLEREEANIIGTVTVTFNSYQFSHIIWKQIIQKKAYEELMKAARKTYEGNIEIRNINIEGSWSGLQIINIAGYGIGAASLFFGVGYVGVPLGALAGNTQKITATGDVVSFSIGGTSGISQQRMNNALKKASEKLIEELILEVPRRTTVAILSVYSDDRAVSAYAIENLEQQFHDARHFTIIERRFIDDIRREKRLQESDDIDQATAAEYAREKGWNIVIIGEISGSGSSRRLVLRAVHAEQNTILSRAMEQF